jgi:hypothetical protein
MAKAVIRRNVKREPAFFDRRLLKARYTLLNMSINKIARVMRLSGANQRPMLSAESGLLVELSSSVRETARSNTVMATGKI